jgi:small GTP-binding protein
LIGKIKEYKTDNNVYVVGYTNAGKSTLINKLLYNYSDTLPTITTSLLPSTTLNSIEIKLDDKLTLIDTPGLLEENTIDNFIDVSMLKKVTPKKAIKPIGGKKHGSK